MTKAWFAMALIVLFYGPFAGPAVSATVPAVDQTTPLSVEDPGTALGTLRWGLRKTDVTLRVQLHEISGRTLLINSSRLLSLTRDTSAGSVAADFDAVDVSPRGTIRLGPYQYADLLVRIRGLGDAAKYTGRLAISTSDGPGVTVPVTVLVRQTWWVAALLIMLGVVTSGMTRYYLTTYRGSLDSQRRLALLADGLDRSIGEPGTLSAGEQFVARRVIEQISGLRGRLAAGERPADQEVLFVGRKAETLPIYLRMRQVVHAAGSPPDAAGYLSTIEEWLVAPDAGGTGQAMDTAAADALTSLLRWRDAMTPMALADLIDRMREAVEPTAPPAGVEPTDWNDLRNQVIAMDGQVDEAAYRRLQERFLSLVIRGLRRQIDHWIAQADGSPSPQELETAGREIKLADEALQAGHLDAAHGHYETARIHCGVWKGGQGALMGTGWRIAPAPGPFHADAVKVATFDQPAVRLPTAKETRRTLRRADATVTGVVAVVAVILGLQLLYFNQWTWGTPLDWITALLWGLGLQPVGGTLFGGLAGLRERLATPAGSGAGR